jgi:ribonuclease-3
MGMETSDAVTMHPELDDLCRRLGYEFRARELLQRSLTHRSFAGGDPAQHNEQFEFLGDAVLSLAMSDLLLARFPHRPEGDLSKIRASLVNEAVLARTAIELGLGGDLYLGKGEERTHGRTKPSILAAAYEAVLGAVYLDGGFGAARLLVSRHFDDAVEAHTTAGLQDYKTRLQELSQSRFREVPTYDLVRESGPDHNKRFVSEISLQGTVYGRGSGRSKKIAEQAAAMEALDRLESTRER